MKLIDGNYINLFLNERDYDVRKSHNARWIDQKCTPDVLTIIADCILEFISGKSDDVRFSSVQIWHNSYTVANVLDIFKKPSPSDSAARNEYDKFFQQPMELLAYAGVLAKYIVNGRNFYCVRNIELLEAISLSERNALKFLVKYITKVLKDSGLIETFEDFFYHQDQEHYAEIKDTFTRFTQNNTPINGKTECWRIFIKVINPLAYEKNSLGTERGRISKDLITYDMLMYNRDNFRDTYQRKPKGITRKMHEVPTPSRTKYIEYLTARAIKYVKLINREYNFGLNEIDVTDSESASQVHHIFPKSTFPEIAYFIENLINLTPNQHNNHAHPNGDYSRVDKEFQRICLIAKVGTVKRSIFEDWGDYDFNNLLFVVGAGYRTNAFTQIKLNDFDEVINQINLAGS